jgi:putative ABC transport system permease protein
LEGYLYGDFLIADESYLNLGNSYMTEARTLNNETLKAVAGLDGVTDVAAVYYDYAEGRPKNGETTIPAQVYGPGDHFLDRLEEAVITGEFDRVKFLSGRYALIGADPEGLFQIGDTVSLNFEDEAAQYEIMAKLDYQRINALTARFYTLPGFSVYLPESELNNRAGVDIMSATVIADAKNTEELRDNIGAVLAENPKLDFRSRADYIKELESDDRQISLVALSLCVIILLIGVLNFFNTTMTNILSRKYEFAMLQAIGMTKKQSRTMLTLECMYFVLITAAVFIIVGYTASFGIVRLLTENTAAYTYDFTILPFVISFPPLCLIAAILPRLLHKGISRDSVVERLREIA